MRPKRAVRHRPTPRQHSRRQRKMKVKKSEIQLLIAVIGVLIAVCIFWYIPVLMKNQMPLRHRM